MSSWHRFILPISGYFRRKRLRVMRQACPALFDNQACTVLDLGGSRHFWANLPIDLALKQVLSNSVLEHVPEKQRKMFVSEIH